MEGDNAASSQMMNQSRKTYHRLDNVGAFIRKNKLHKNGAKNIQFNEAEIVNGVHKFEQYVIFCALITSRHLYARVFTSKHLNC